MPQGKRKRSADKISARFPDEASHSANKPTAEGAMKSSSLSKAWIKCGEGFQKCLGEKKCKPSGGKFQAVRHLAQSFLFDEETSAESCGKDPADIVWSSSDSSMSNDGSEEADLLPDISEISPQSASRLNDTEMSVSAEGCSRVVADVLTITDFQDDNDLECGSDKGNVSENAESVVEISGSESSTSDLLSSQQCKPELSKALNIVEYLSDEPEDEYSVPAERQNIPVCEENILPSGGRTVSDWVKTAQILLQTPEKKIDKTFKTPEDSAKKKKRFLRGGLAERLSRLQNRERSAITFWRHQSGSDCRIPLGDKSGTLLVKLIDVHEECAIWIAACQQLTDIGTIDNPPINHCKVATKLKVLFSRQTADKLKPKANDIIYIYPPWLYLLIQDAYGIFSELQVQLTHTAIEDIQKYSQMFEGKSCCFSGLKILQRTTRGRAPGLFSLIDSLWPPLAPIKIHGQSQEQGEIPCALPAPSFCYVLALRYEEGGYSIKPGDTVSDLYLPPVIHSLDEILQLVVLSQRCSFWATVIYVRPEIQGNVPLQKEFWIYVTDATLQVTPETSRIPKILPVCVLPSCAVDSRVLEALAKSISCKMLFKDAVKENGKIICVERTVLSLQKPLLSHTSGVNELTCPVTLDELDSASEANSLCIVTGIINGVNERESFSWPVCNLCGSSKLQPSDSDRHKYFCRHCAADVSSPIIRMKLEVYLHCELTPGRKVKLKLQQNTISSLLSSCFNEDGRYEVSAILGKQVGPVTCYVQHVNSSVGLEEICLLQAGIHDV
ncbi:PREDICTED: DNA repair-scaffolding protein [Nanorana parkeri]|uniref:DNA repair-scaffolding protein n=1 Tax=Nanorana parkeri TaxID=125878 RepID=UPI0008548354|nr:PREDICTED: DNA repair-scaffolding protein [Nanorana parkeri]